MSLTSPSRPSPPVTLKQRLRAYVELCRFDKPIGTLLVFWPTLWALWLASGGLPPIRILCIMTLGVIFMRAAGCAINDYADRDFDGHVARTRQRPLPSGLIRPIEALIICILLLAASAALLVFLPIKAFYWSIGAALLAVLYPFMKRYTNLPQVVLGAAFSWSIPLAYAAVGQTPDLTCWLLYFANLAWTVAYDTQYAMTDREDDLKIGVKSIAIWFGRADLLMIGLLQATAVGLWFVVFKRESLMPVAGVALAIVAVDFVYQLWRIRKRQPEQTFWAFRHNRYIGLVIWLGIALAYLLLA